MFVLCVVHHLESISVEKLGGVVLRARQQQGPVLVQRQAVNVLRVDLFSNPDVRVTI